MCTVKTENTSNKSEGRRTLLVPVFIDQHFTTMGDKMIANRGLLFRPPLQQKITGTLQTTPEFRKKIRDDLPGLKQFWHFFCVKQRIEGYERREKREKETWITLRCAVMCCG